MKSLSNHNGTKKVTTTYMFTEISSEYFESLSFENFSSEQLLVLMVESVAKLNWHIGPISELGFIAYIKRTASTPSCEVRVEINGKRVNMESKSAGIRKSDKKQNEENIKILSAKCIEVQYIFTPYELNKKYGELRPRLVSKDVSFLRQPPSTAKEDIAGFIGIFKPRDGYYITPILINLNIVLFFLMIISGVNIMYPNTISLIKWGANYTPYTLKGEWWRLLTCGFLHIGIVHLFANIYAFIYIGLLLEPHLGKTRFVAAYLLTCLAASATSLWWHDKVLSAGASGAIFGMYGVFLALLTTNIINKDSRGALLASIAFFVIFNLLGGMRYGIDNAAHVGGLVSGFIIGYAFVPGLKNKAEEI